MRRASKALILLIALVGSSIVYAADGDSVNLTVGRSTVVDTGTSITRVSLTSADIADALVTSSNELLINGKNPGTISMFVWDRTGAIHKYEINVQRDLARLTDQLKQLFPGEKITAHSSGKSIVLSGEVTAAGVADKAKEVAAGYVDKKDEVVSLLQVLPSSASNQVLLKVRFAEVSRNAMTQLGASWYSDGYKNTIGSVTTGQFPAPFFDANKAMVGEHQVFSDYLNLFLFDFKHELGAVIKALQSRGLFQSLAEPNLVAQSGKEASFLAGGEFPIPVAQASGSNIAISIQFKEFGIRLNFLPTIVGDRIQLHVRPEVSTLDFNNAILLQGFRIPALSSRRAETDVELQNGQTFAIAGLLNNTISSSLQKIPGIGDIPVLGNLFKSRAANKEQTELVVMITPEIVSRNSSGATSTLPRISEPFMAPLPQNKSMDMPPPAFRRPASGAAGQTPAPAAKPSAANTDPAAAAAAVSALTPGSVPVVSTAAPAPATPAAANRPLTKDEQAALERLKKQERQHKDQSAKQSATSQRKAEDEARRQAEADKRQAEANKAAKEAAVKRAAEAAKRQAENDRRQAELDKQREKSLEEAEAKVKAAQAAYDAEVAKSKKQ
jgi:pilus assembly protein CpaC